MAHKKNAEMRVCEISVWWISFSNPPPKMGRAELVSPGVKVTHEINE